MLAFFVLAALAVVSAGLPLDSLATAQADNARIIGGSTTTIDQYPYQVIVERKNGYMKCGGTIIAKNVVLTAAQCVSDIGSYEYRIRAGSSYPGQGGSVHDYQMIIFHEGYFGEPQVNDIALIFVVQPFEFDSSRQPINLRSSAEEISEGTSATITGFGRLSYNGVVPTQLQHVQVPIVSKQVCNEAYSEFDGIGPGQICAGNLGVGGKGSCQGDAGSPVVIDGQLAGVVSYSYKCGEPNYPSVFMEVAYYYDWIVANGGLPA